MSFRGLTFEKSLKAFPTPRSVAQEPSPEALRLARKQALEDCAKLIETTDLGGLKDNPKIQAWVAALLTAYAAAIRAMGDGDKA